MTFENENGSVLSIYGGVAPKLLVGSNILKEFINGVIVS